jgi:hypothetical protein
MAAGALWSAAFGEISNTDDRQTGSFCFCEVFVLRFELW